MIILKYLNYLIKSISISKTNEDLAVLLFRNAYKSMNIYACI